MVVQPHATPPEGDFTTHSDWRRLESNRLLMEPRKKVVSSIFRLLMAALILPFVPLALGLVWLVFIFGTNLYMGHLITVYSALLADMPSPRVISAAMLQTVRRYKGAWWLNAGIWGLVCFLLEFWLPLTPRLAGIAVLNALMFLSITRTYVDFWLMHRVSATFVGLQFVSSFLHFLVAPDPQMGGALMIAHVLYLALISYLLWVVGNRFHQMHKQRLDFEHSKLELIESLRHSQALLHREQKELVAANNLVQQFYSGAAHDLRQPVYAMQLYTQMLTDSPDQADLLLPKIRQSCAGINDMFNQLFDFQKMHMLDIQLEEEDVDIAEAFKNLSLHFQPIAHDKQLTLRFKPLPGAVHMTPMYLIRILSNLISNAIRYTDAGGVLIGVRKTATQLRFEVWDTGIGIPEPVLAHIFDEFYKADNEGKTEGLGLGLAISKQLTARIEGGDLAVQSRLGRGSVFKFSVPLARYRPAAPAAS